MRIKVSIVKNSLRILAYSTICTHMSTQSFDICNLELKPGAIKSLYSHVASKRLELFQ
jgi:hypothetical protein